MYHLDAHVAEAIRTDDRRIVITGAGGWLGLATLELLCNAIGEDFAARVVCFGSRARTLELRDGTGVSQRPIGEIGDLVYKPSIVLHLAYLTKDRAEHMTPEAYRAANRALSSIVLDALEAIGAIGVFLPSSGAASVADLPTASEAMRAYGLLKRDDEEGFATWAEKDDSRLAVIARIFNVSGPYINKPEAYALSAFIRDALKGQPVHVKAKRRVVRSFVAIRELMSIVFALLLGDTRGAVRFDTGAEEELEMRELADSIANLAGNGKMIAEDIDINLPPDIYVGDQTAYEVWRHSSRVGKVPFSVQVKETAAYLANSDILGKAA